MENKVVDGLRCCIEHGTLGGKSCRGYYVWTSDHSNIVKEDAHEDECPYKNCEMVASLLWLVMRWLR